MQYSFLGAMTRGGASSHRRRRGHRHRRVATATVATAMGVETESRRSSSRCVPPAPCARNRDRGRPTATRNVMSGSMHHTQADCKQMDWHQALEPWSALVRTDPRNCAEPGLLERGRTLCSPRRCIPDLRAPWFELPKQGLRAAAGSTLVRHPRTPNPGRRPWRSHPALTH